MIFRGLRIWGPETPLGSFDFRARGKTDSNTFIKLGGRETRPRNGRIGRIGWDGSETGDGMREGVFQNLGKGEGVRVCYMGSTI